MKDLAEVLAITYLAAGLALTISGRIDVGRAYTLAGLHNARIAHH